MPGRQEVSGSTPLFSTHTSAAPDTEHFTNVSGVYSAKIQPHYLSLGYIAIPELPYTIPRLVKGKRIESVFKGSSFAKEEASQNWYIEFFFHNAETGRIDRFRPTKNLNRIKDPREELKHFTNLCEAYKVALEGGWNPIDDKANDKLKKEIISITGYFGKVVLPHSYL